jgi:hypothetical protein
MKLKIADAKTTTTFLAMIKTATLRRSKAQTEFSGFTFDPRRTI